MKTGPIRFAMYGIFAVIIGASICDTLYAAEKEELPVERVLVKDGQSAYGIYYDGNAPLCVKRAAMEMQRVIRISTGVTLPILAAPKSPASKRLAVLPARRQASTRAGNEGWLPVCRATLLPEIRPSKSRASASISAHVRKHSPDGEKIAPPLRSERTFSHLSIIRFDISLCRGAIKPGQCAIKLGHAQSAPIRPPERSVGGRMGATPQGGGALISRVKNLIASS